MLFSCPQCTRRFRWKEEIAGRKTRCKQCQTVIKIPDAPEAPEADPVDDYGLVAGENAPDGPAGDAEKYEPIDHDGHCPQCNSDIAISAVLCLNCGFDLRSGEAIQTEVQEVPAEDESEAPVSGRDLSLSASRTALASTKRLDHESLEADVARQHRRTEFIVPLIAIGIGVVLALVNVLVLAPLVAGSLDWPAPELIIPAVFRSTVSVVVGVPLVFFAMIPITMLFGSSYGDIRSVLLKLVALLLISCGMVLALDHFLLWGSDGLARSGMRFQMFLFYGAFFAFGMWLLDTEWQEVTAMWVPLFLLQYILDFFGIILFC